MIDSILRIGGGIQNLSILAIVVIVILAAAAVTKCNNNNNNNNCKNKCKVRVFI
jgi:hypothetical protein